jgi:hypothetical protein
VGCGCLGSCGVANWSLGAAVVGSGAQELIWRLCWTRGRRCGVHDGRVTGKGGLLTAKHGSDASFGGTMLTEAPGSKCTALALL